MTSTGQIRFREVAEGRPSCSLDVAELGGVTLEEIGDIFGQTRERIRQVEVKALMTIRMHFGDRARVEAGEPPLDSPDTAVYRAACPTCGAEQGRLCRGLAGDPRDQPHVLRERASRLLGSL